MNEKVKCIVCGKEESNPAEIKGNWLVSESGKIVCSDECRESYEEKQKSSLLRYSRITGYMQEVSGWNKGKVAELNDRHRYNKGI